MMEWLAVAYVAIAGFFWGYFISSDEDHDYLMTGFMAATWPFTLMVIMGFALREAGK